MDRAQAVRPDFQATQANAPAVAALCEHLEGIPLAVELAAAQAKVLTPSQMLEQLTHRFDFLISNRRDVVPRHATLRAAIDWSYQQLSPELRRFFMHLAVFRGGWHPSAAAAVCEEPRALDYLAQLQERSLIVAEEYGGEIRFRMLETLREYVGEQLNAEELKEQMRLAHRHMNFFLDLAIQAEPHLMGPDEATWLNRLEVEHDNLRAALDWCHGIESGAEIELRLAGALWRFWLVRGYPNEGRERLMSALHRKGVESHTQARAKALIGVVALALSQGDRAAVQSFYEESLAINRELGDRLGIASVLTSLGTNTYEQGDHVAALSLFEESLGIQRELDDKPGMALTLNNLGIVFCEQGNYVSGCALYEESLEIRRELGDRLGIATVLNNLGIAAFDQGDHTSALTFHEESLEIRRELEDKAGIASSLRNLADVVCQKGDYAAATSFAQDSLTTQRELGNRLGIALSLSTLGDIAYYQGDYERARALYKESLALRRERGNSGGVAWLLGKFARLWEAQGQPERAVRMFGAADALCIAAGCPVPPIEQAHYDSSILTARAVLGEEVYAAAWAQGRVMSLEQASAYALDEKSLAKKPLP